MSVIASFGAAPAGGSNRELDDVMTIMEDAFDPRFGEGWSRSQCDGMLGDVHSWITLISMDDEPAGFAMARMIVDEAELLLIAVRPSFRGRGIGQDLLRQVQATAAERGAKRLHLEMRAGNAAAKLYHAAGFEKIGHRRNYYSGENGERFDAITLALELDPVAG